MRSNLKFRVIKEALSARNKSLQALYYIRFNLSKYLFDQKIFSEENLYLNIPVRVEGRGTISFGNKVCLGCTYGPRIGSGEIFLQTKEDQASIYIGAGSVLNNNVTIIAYQSIRIEENCLIGDYVSIFDGDFHSTDPIERHASTGNSAPVHIGKNVWIGSRAIIMKGITIGENSVVSAGAVVTKSIPSNVIAAGVPAKIIKQL